MGASSELGDLHRRVKDAIIRHNLISRGDRVMVACSGGPDSLCLARVLGDLAPQMDFSLVWAHVDHGLRPESADEAVQVTKWAEQMGVQCHVKRVQVQGKAEEAAREARYRALEEMAAEAGADRVATAHTAEDQAETVVMRLIRGSGLRGLKGIPWKRGPFIRPMLGLRRHEVSAFVGDAGLVPLVDPTNTSMEFFRNRVRLKILPMLSEENPRVVESLCRLAENARRELEALESEGAGQGAESVRRLTGPAGMVGVELAFVGGGDDNDPGGTVAWRNLRKAHLEVARSMGRAAVQAGQLESKHLAALNAINSRRGSVGSWQMDLPGGVCALGTGGERLWVLPAVWLEDPGDWDWEIDRTGSHTLSESGMSWQLEVRANEDGAECDCFPLRFRNFRPGDRVSLPDGHTAKVQDLFVNAKLPRPLRRRLPLLTRPDGTGRAEVCWVPGVFPGTGFQFVGERVTLFLEPGRNGVEEVLLRVASV